MEDYLAYKTFRLKQQITEENRQILLRSFSKTQGINSVKCAGQIFSVVFDPYEISEKEIEKILALNNFSIKQPGRNFLKRKLEKLAEDNKKNLGNNRLDCCGLNE